MNIRKSAPALALPGMVAMALSAAPFAAARADDDTDLSLNYVPGSSMKIEQVIGDCDWAIYDQTSPPVCQRTVSQTTTRSDVSGNGLGASFEHEGNLIFLFGDTIGASQQYVPQYVSPALETKFNDLLFDAADPIAWSATRRAEDGLNLSFFPSHTANTPTLLVQPQYPVVHHFPEGDSTFLPMGGDDIPDSGISIDGQIYVAVSTGADGTLADAQLNEYSVLVRFDPRTGTFAAGRTVSQAFTPKQNPPPPKIGGTPGHFVATALQALPSGFAGRDGQGVFETQPHGFDAWEPSVLIFGEGQFRGISTGSSVYLSIVPQNALWSGLDRQGNSATRYFTGLRDGHPTWSDEEADAVPVVFDNPTNLPVPQGPPGFDDPGTVGNISVLYAAQLGLWLMTYDGGRQTPQTTSVYFTYAPAPWGPWAKPQLIFHDCRDHGFGEFIHYYFDPKKPEDNICPGAVTGNLHASGPAGPTIGDQNPNNAKNNFPPTTRGGAFAPEIERFTEVEGDRLKIYYALSTWNPYTVVKMRSELRLEARR